MSIITHSLCLFFKFGFKWSQFHGFKATQIIDSVLVLLSIYLFLFSIELFAELQAFDITSAKKLNPNANHIAKGKANKTADDEETIVLQRYYMWSLLEVSLFFSYIYSIIVYLLFHSLSPFTAY
mmetsp:Transcript_11758/g.14895  ORF Transcript_11758/g.14895 Transcript_11758/m.14895 type:complete len:124 (+) Transcript_11758:174-545(+)